MELKIRITVTQVMLFLITIILLQSLQSISILIEHTHPSATNIVIEHSQFLNC